MVIGSPLLPHIGGAFWTMACRHGQPEKSLARYAYVRKVDLTKYNCFYYGIGILVRWVYIPLEQPTIWSRRNLVVEYSIPISTVKWMLQLWENWSWDFIQKTYVDISRAWRCDGGNKMLSSGFVRVVTLYCCTCNSRVDTWTTIALIVVIICFNRSSRTTCYTKQ